MEFFLGQIILAAFNFAPPNFMECNGQLLPIQQYTALFSLLGTTFGGDGRVTFGLPDLRGRAPIHFGQSTNGSNFEMGQQVLPATLGGTTGPGALTMNYFIMVQNGVFPSRP